MGGGATHVRIPLEEPMRSAPAGWREALKPIHGRPHIYKDVVRLSERPLAPGAATPVAGAPSALPTGAGVGLAVAPIAGFYAPGPGGPLPIIAQDGRTPAQAYARPFTSNGRPKVSLVIGGLGLNQRATRQAIETLRPEITLSFVVYAEGLQGWIDMARAHGHEVLLETPMEPLDYPDNDPGPYTLMADGQPPETVKKLEWILSRATGYFGLTNYLGSRFLGVDTAYNAFASSVKGRGLAFIDDGGAARRGGGMARATAERVIDDKLTGPAIDQQLMALEGGALQRGQALGSGFAYPVTLEKVAAWANEVETRGYQLAPASALTAKK
ncbi:MAG: divergent polysaccharide deacetylase family protein [Alphaproteobacteria bacterium]|nr:divergent polysaccharide deacetylase family protein [Alphaproteobacteria bacterium]MBU1517175.1 divergent polysaccharide deacetylase family protein [Alphaproteobacteria bacterium]MBU2093289.1 divergent polysaccharide deacetylase family protein [Alphaproteobacteria bacterium]MBU2150034.1 divergent polysaccharide deacetylase family protein [Alphaproteobacteria bacterium]MBU2307791.1 divergent polysaccharide deacetylase family protein [Alphaproteobacteria bacterium]